MTTTVHAATTSSTDIEDPQKHAATLLSDRRNQFIESRRAVGNQLIKQLKYAADVRDNELLSQDAFLRDCGVAEEDVVVFSQVTEEIRNFLEAIPTDRITQSLIRALINPDGKPRQVADDEARKRVDQEIRERAIIGINSGVAVASNEISRLFASATDRQLSDQLSHLQDGQATLKSGAQSLADRKERQLLAQMQLLYRKMLDYEDNGCSAANNAHKEIADLSRIALDSFRELFGDEFPEVKAWFRAGLEQPERCYLAQCHYALSELANGNFDTRFPELESALVAWSAFDGINYLAGIPETDKRCHLRRDHDARARLGPRPVRKLTAIDLCSKSGGQALGLEAAGFSLELVHENQREHSAKTIKANRPDWNLKIADIRDPDVLKDIIKAHAAKIDLLSAALPTAPWGRGGEGDSDIGSLLQPALDLITGLHPRAFFLETTEYFETKRYLVARDKFLQKCAALKYRVDIFSIEAADHGVPQQGRFHTFIVGIEEKKWGQYKAASFNMPHRTYLANTLKDIAFPHRPQRVALKYSEKFTPERTKELRYRTWAACWLKSHKKTLAPDLRKAMNSEAWRKHGLLARLVQDMPLTNESASKFASIPLTVQAIARLQGMPDDWVFSGKSIEDKYGELRSLTPPLVALAVARSIYTALTGEEFDETAPGSLMVKSGKQKPSWHRTIEGMRLLKGLSPERSWNNSPNPDQYLAEEWFHFMDDLDRSRELELVQEACDDDDLDDPVHEDFGVYQPNSAASRSSSIRFQTRSATLSGR